MLDPIETYVEELKVLLDGHLPKEQIDILAGETMDHLEEIQQQVAGDQQALAEVAVGRFGPVEKLARKIVEASAAAKSSWEASLWPLVWVTAVLLATFVLPGAIFIFGKWTMFSATLAQIVGGCGFLYLAAKTRRLFLGQIALFSLGFAAIIVTYYWRADHLESGPILAARIEEIKEDISQHTSESDLLSEGLQVFSGLKRAASKVGYYAHEGKYISPLYFKKESRRGVPLPNSGFHVVRLPRELHDRPVQDFLIADWDEAARVWKRDVPDRLQGLQTGFVRDMSRLKEIEQRAVAKPRLFWWVFTDLLPTCAFTFLWLSMANLLAYGVQKLLDRRLPRRRKLARA